MQGKQLQQGMFMGEVLKIVDWWVMLLFLNSIIQTVTWHHKLLKDLHMMERMARTQCFTLLKRLQLLIIFLISVIIFTVAKAPSS